MFGKHNVSGIIAGFTKMRARLDAAAAHHTQRSQDHLANATYHRDRAEAAQSEADRAAAVASRIKALVEPTDDEIAGVR